MFWYSDIYTRVQQNVAWKSSSLIQRLWFGKTLKPCNVLNQRNSSWSCSNALFVIKRMNNLRDQGFLQQCCHSESAYETKNSLLWSWFHWKELLRWQYNIFCSFFISIVIYEILRLVWHTDYTTIVTSHRIMSFEKFGCKNKKPYWMKCMATLLIIYRKARISR